MTGWRRDEIIGRTPFDLNLWVDPTQRAKMAEEIQTKGTVRNLEFALSSQGVGSSAGLGSAELIEIAGEPCLFPWSQTLPSTNRSRSNCKSVRQG